MANRLVGIGVKIERAERHAYEFQTEWMAFGKRASVTAWLLIDLKSAANVALKDPLFPLTDALTDWNTQGITSADANLQAMAGRKSNDRMQSCEEALQGTAAQIASFMNTGVVGPALHAGEAWATPVHGGRPWNGNLLDREHLKGDWLDFSWRNFRNRIHNDMWIMSNMPRGGGTVTMEDVLSNMRGGHCQQWSLLRTAF